MASETDPTFTQAMHDLLGMDEQAVEDVLEELDSGQLQDLMDAVAKKDREAAQQIVGKFDTDEEVNSLFRGKNIQVSDRKRKIRHNHDGKMQFGIGDDVRVTLRNDDGKKSTVTGTVSNPHGPEGTDTIVVRIKGETKVIDRRDVDKLDEGVLGMFGMPELGRIQQLAGIPNQAEAAPQIEIGMEPEADITAEPAPDDPAGMAMSALDTLEAALPNITVADAKLVRQRLGALQMMMNESIGTPSFLATLGRNRKH